VIRFSASLEHVGVAARDSASLADWYTRVLGATVRWTNGATPPAFLLELAAGGVVEIYPAAEITGESAPNGRQGIRHLALRIAHLDTARAALESLGVVFTESVKPAGGGGKVQFFQDPEGNLLHLVERPYDAGVPQ
jgi:catechol 2,3-dioxygenase-like lactoylglutathione lyase family enzyme